MLQQIYDYARQLFTLKNQTEKNAADVQELQKEVKELAAAVQNLTYVVQRNQDNERLEREDLLLRLELLLRADRSLPPALPPSEIEKDAQIAALKEEVEELKKRLEQRERKKT